MILSRVKENLSTLRLVSHSRGTAPIKWCKFQKLVDYVNHECSCHWLKQQLQQQQLQQQERQLLPLSKQIRSSAKLKPVVRLLQAFSRS